MRRIRKAARVPPHTMLVLVLVRVLVLVLVLALALVLVLVRVLVPCLGPFGSPGC